MTENKETDNIGVILGTKQNPIDLGQTGFAKGPNGSFYATTGTWEEVTSTAGRNLSKGMTGEPLTGRNENNQLWPVYSDAQIAEIRSDCIKVARKVLEEKLDSLNREQLLKEIREAIKIRAIETMGESKEIPLEIGENELYVSEKGEIFATTKIIAILARCHTIDVKKRIKSDRRMYGRKGKKPTSELFPVEKISEAFPKRAALMEEILKQDIAQMESVEAIKNAVKQAEEAVAAEGIQSTPDIEEPSPDKRDGGDAIQEDDSEKADDNAGDEEGVQDTQDRDNEEIEEEITSLPEQNLIKINVSPVESEEGFFTDEEERLYGSASVTENLTSLPAAEMMKQIGAYEFEGGLYDATPCLSQDSEVIYPLIDVLNCLCDIHENAGDFESEDELFNRFQEAFLRIEGEYEENEKEEEEKKDGKEDEKKKDDGDDNDEEKIDEAKWHRMTPDEKLVSLKTRNLLLPGRQKKVGITRSNANEEGFYVIPREYPELQAWLDKKVDLQYFKGCDTVVLVARAGKFALMPIDIKTIILDNPE